MIFISHFMATCTRDSEACWIPKTSSMNLKRLKVIKRWMLNDLTKNIDKSFLEALFWAVWLILIKIASDTGGCREINSTLDRYMNTAEWFFCCFDRFSLFIFVVIFGALVRKQSNVTKSFCKSLKGLILELEAVFQSDAFSVSTTPLGNSFKSLMFSHNN